MKSDTTQLRELMVAMRETYARGRNAMAHARQVSDAPGNSSLATLIAYDLQAGTYIAAARANPESNARWCAQLANILAPFVTAQSTILEVGCGEATTLAGVLQHLPIQARRALGFDISWSRCKAGCDWLASNQLTATLFVADLFEIPLADSSVDIVYTSHSLEPNGGREEAALRELLRVARRAVVLVEPLYELAGEEAQARMRHHGYIRGLQAAADRLGVPVSACRLLDYISNPLNPSGLVLMEKAGDTSAAIAPRESVAVPADCIEWRCPLTHTPMRNLGDVYVSDCTGLAFPVLRGVPLLRAEHAIVASKLLAR